MHRYIRKDLPPNCYVVSGPRDCWLWKFSLNSAGYAIVRMNKKLWLVHKWLYEKLNGPVPDGLTLDHVDCIAKHCINPDHVEPVTNQENVRRARKRIREARGLAY